MRLDMSSAVGIYNSRFLNERKNCWGSENSEVHPYSLLVTYRKDFVDVEEHLWKTKHVWLQIYTSSLKFTSEILEIFKWHYFWETIIIGNLICTTTVFGM